jgi:hypothetical protein
VANSFDAFVPELWANESLAILEENMVAANLVHRDFEPMIAKFGDIVNTRKPAEFTAKRKTDADSVTVQDASATNIPVTLNQHLHTTFLIKDGEDSKSFKSLVDEYLRPAMLSLARMIDQIVLGQVHQFYANVGGGLGLLTDATAKGYILETREAMNLNNAPMEGRNLIVAPNSETELLKLDLFNDASKVGDNGTALREASLGRKLGFDIFMCQNAASVATGQDTRGFQINNAAGYVAGDSALTVDTGTGEVVVGTWVKIGGFPYRVTARTGTAPTTAITVSPVLRAAVADNAAVTVYDEGAVNLVAGYAVGYAKEIVIDGFSAGKAPKVGQLVTFTNATGAIYTVVQVTGDTGITLDRPLEAALSDNDGVFIGPAGDYNFAFCKNAVALITRPLALPRSGTGAAAAVVNFNGLSIRIVMQYDSSLQGTRVTCDLLCGVKVLEGDLGAVLLG